MGRQGYDGHALVARAHEARSVSELFRTASGALRRLVPFDAAAWLAADPATGLPSAPSHLENVDAGRRMWELEFMAEDVNRFRDLAHAEPPAASLRLATGDRPERSTRYRALVRPDGFDDELRAVLRADGRPWALVALLRAGAFSAEETAFVASLCEPLGEAVRDVTRALLHPQAPLTDTGPGMLVFDADGALSSLNDAAAAWLDELDDGGGEPHETGVRLPVVVLSTLMRARAIAAEGEHGHARTQARGASGRWLICHASCLRTVDGRLGETALVIEPASGSALAPLIAEAYELSLRERQIAELIREGCATGEIAERLHLSPHTVRDHVKTLFEKLGVSTRGQLVALLFAGHHVPTRAL